MSGRYVVDLQWNMGNTSQFRSSMSSTLSQIRSSYQAASNSTPTSSARMPNISMGNITSQINAHDRTLKLSGQVFHQYVSGYASDMKRLESATRALSNSGIGAGPTSSGRYSSFGSSMNPTTGRVGVSAKDLRPEYKETPMATRETWANLDKVYAAEQRLIPLGMRLADIDRRRAIATEGYTAKLKTGKLVAEQLDTQIYANSLAMAAQTTGRMGSTYTMRVGPRAGQTVPWLRVQDKEINNLYNAWDPATQGYIFGGAVSTEDERRQKAARDVVRNRRGPNKRVQRALTLARGIDVLDQESTALQAEATQVDRILKGAERGQRTSSRVFRSQEAGALWGARGDIRGYRDALNSAPPIPSDLDNLLRSKNFRNSFMRDFGMTTPYVAPAGPRASATDIQSINTQRDVFSRQLLERGINSDTIKVVKDLGTGITKVSGTMKNAEGSTVEYSRSLDRHMKTVEKTGNAYRNTGGFLRQTAKDFSKVIEWTVATTLVFGSLGLVIGSFSKINEINKDLQRFAITAKTTSSETQTAFNDIASIAYKTATPIKELTAVMDDIALATRRVGQTSEEWKTAINSLATSVGILTNLTGVDTVRATDLLSAAYKQLQMQPQELIGVLNKVTAVAGGNAQAIEDIVAALGSVSEAAKSAGVNLDYQIAAVQTISQVTNKSATEVAVSFKNLFGSLGSAGSEKALDKVGIKLRDQEGNIRDFLVVYKEVYDAVQSGQIGENQLQEVIKGMAGGPRRAPDAAAVVANMPLIYDNYARSVGATNEALIANARVLDTNAAKLQQVRTQFDTALVDTFTESINKLVSVFVTLGGAITGVIGTGISGSIITQIMQIGLLTTAFFGLYKVIGLISRARLGIKNKFAETALYEKLSRLEEHYRNPNVLPTRRIPTQPLPPTTTPFTPNRRPLTTAPIQRTPYVPVSRPITYPASPQIINQMPYQGTRGYRALMYRSVQSVLPFTRPVGVGGLSQGSQFRPLGFTGPVQVNPATGLVSLRQQAKEELAYRKSQLTNLGTFIKERGTQEANGIKTLMIQQAEYRKWQLTQTLSTNKQIIQNQLGYYKDQLSGYAGYVKDMAKYSAKNFVRSTAGRSIMGVGAGIAGAAALGVVGAATNNLSALSAAGQGIGVTIAMLGGPAGIAAGATLAALSTALGVYADNEQKAAEKSKAMRFSVYESLNTLKDQRTSIYELETAQAAALKTMDKFSGKTDLNTEDLGKLRQAQNSYVESSIKLSDVNLSMADTLEKLNQQLSQLDADKYGKIVKAIQSGNITDPNLLKDLASMLASDLISTPGYAKTNFSPPDTTRPSSRVIDIGNTGKVIGGADLNTTQFYDKLFADNTAKTAMDFLNRGGLGGSGLGGEAFRVNTVEINDKVLQLMSVQLDAASDDVKATAAWREAAKELSYWINLLPAPAASLNNNIAGLQSQITSDILLGNLKGKDADNAQIRSNIAEEFQKRLGYLPTQASQQGRSGREYTGPRKGTTYEDITSLLTGVNGSGGLLGGAKGYSIADLTVDEAKTIYDKLASIDPALKGLTDNVDTYYAGMYEFFLKAGKGFEEFKSAYDKVAADEELQNSLSESIRTGKLGLYGELLNLRSRKQGGEFKDDKTGAYKTEYSQLKALIFAYDKLGVTFEENSGKLEDFKDALGQINGLQGIQLETTDQLLPALIEHARALGLNGDQIRDFVAQMQIMLKNLDALSKIKAKFTISADATQAIKTLKAIRAAIVSTYTSMYQYAGPSSYANYKPPSNIKELDAAIKALEAQQKAANILAKGAGSAFNNPATSKSSSSDAYNKPGLLDVPEEFKDQNRTVKSYLTEAIANAKKLQSQVPGETKANRKEIVAILDGTKKVMQTKGIGEEYLRRAMEELTDEIKKQNDLLAKADMMSRIRIGGGDFAALANVPMNSQSGVSVGSPGGTISVNLNINGQTLTPAQFDLFANKIAASLARQMANG